MFVIPALTASPDVIPESSIVNDSRYQSREEFNVVTSSTDVSWINNLFYDTE